MTTTRTATTTKSYKERTLYYNFGVSLCLKFYYCLEKARLASNQLGASSNGWHLICGEREEVEEKLGHPL